LEDKPGDMFGKVMSISDVLMLRYYELLTTEDLGRVKMQHPMEAKQSLAELIVARYHGSDAGRQARAEFQQKFQAQEFPDQPDKHLLLTSNDLPDRDPSGVDSTKLAKLIAATGLVASNSEARRLIVQGGVEVDSAKASNPDQLISFMPNQQRRLKIGKRKFALVEYKTH
jgi:tyrosyl-tRNA synthetase